MARVRKPKSKNPLVAPQGTSVPPGYNQTPTPTTRVTYTPTPTATPGNYYQEPSNVDRFLNYGFMREPGIQMMIAGQGQRNLVNASEYIPENSPVRRYMSGTPAMGNLPGATGMVSELPPDERAVYNPATASADLNTTRFNYNNSPVMRYLDYLANRAIAGSNGDVGQRWAQDVLKAAANGGAWNDPIYHGKVSPEEWLAAVRSAT